MYLPFTYIRQRTDPSVNKLRLEESYVDYVIERRSLSLWRSRIMTQQGRRGMVAKHVVKIAISTTPRLAVQYLPKRSLILFACIYFFQVVVPPMCMCRVTWSYTFTQRPVAELDATECALHDRHHAYCYGQLSSVFGGFNPWTHPFTLGRFLRPRYKLISRAVVKLAFSTSCHVMSYRLS